MKIQNKLLEKYNKLDWLFTTLHALENVNFDYISEKEIDKAIDKVTKKIYEVIK